MSLAGKKYLYVYAKVKGRPLAYKGGYKFCTTNRAFTIDGRHKYCPSYQTAKYFLRYSNGGKPHHTVNFK